MKSETILSGDGGGRPATIEDARTLLEATCGRSPNIDSISMVALNSTGNPTEHTVSIPKTAIVVEPGAEVIISDGTGGDCSLFIGEGAIVRYHTLSHRHSDAAHRAAYLAKDAQLDWIDASLEGSSSNNVAFLAHDGAKAKFRSVFLGTSDARFATSIRMIHAAPRTESNMLTRVALLERSAASYRGYIEIAPHAHGCVAVQRADTLLIGDKSRMDALPVLEVCNDDVTCSHGVTIGRVDDDKLFYLSSRGIQRQQSQSLLVQGFFDQILISMGVYGQELQRSILQRLQQTTE